MANAWDAYKNSLMAENTLDAVGIFGIKGGAPWTVTDNFTVSEVEVAKMCEGFANNSSLIENGITANGCKYFYLQSDNNQIQGKKGPDGISICKTGQCVIIGTYGKDKFAGPARKTVEDMGGYLRNAGF